MENVLNRNLSEKESERLKTILDLVKDNPNDFDSILALVLVLEKAIDLYEKKDIISRSFAKPYAILSSTNKVQKDLIQEIINKQNDNKGQSKKMLYNIIMKALDSIKQNQESDNKGFFSRLRNR